MPKQPSWKVDVKSLSHNQIVDLLEKLQGSGRQDIILSLRQELIGRARIRGLSDAEIVKSLSRGVPRGLRLQEVAKEWAEALGLTVEEFKRIANVRYELRDLSPLEEQQASSPARLLFVDISLAAFVGLWKLWRVSFCRSYA
ncbi:MAG: hypothetical protein A3F90_00525 [Deltaproteobacteria bacterium RIFCSPLOWO2_12_FULL_60_19]|nr:MAG: hypothetical protein A3F90_00525 [Deltaproteobacteria bacterium RIFCSPLOWO2_12_FULL_60_19]